MPFGCNFFLTSVGMHVQGGMRNCCGDIKLTHLRYSYNYFIHYLSPPWRPWLFLLGLVRRISNALAHWSVSLLVLMLPPPERGHSGKASWLHFIVHAGIITILASAYYWRVDTCTHDRIATYVAISHAIQTHFPSRTWEATNFFQNSCHGRANVRLRLLRQFARLYVFICKVRELRFMQL